MVGLGLFAATYGCTVCGRKEVRWVVSNWPAKSRLKISPFDFGRIGCARSMARKGWNESDDVDRVTNFPETGISGCGLGIMGSRGRALG